VTLPAELAVAIDRTVDARASELVTLARRIHAHPELRFEEHQASKWIAELLAAHGHGAELGVAGLPTALRARAGSGGPPTVAILAEYDALPDLGHACGHNLIAAGAVGAFLAGAQAVKQLKQGEVILLGTPGEEGGGGKIRMLEGGAFAGVDAAMMFHPFDRDLTAHTSLASSWLSLQFRGTPAHAALAPHAGSSALTACMDTFRLVDGQRMGFRDGVRVHGYITDGGQAVNVIVERAASEFNVRARDGGELRRVQAIVERCARAAAMASDVQVEITTTPGYRDMLNNLSLARCFGRHLRALGRPFRERDDTAGAASTDMGDVSHAMPAIHPWLAITSEGTASCHERAFAEAAVGDQAWVTVSHAAKAMARTALDFLTDVALRAEVKAEWQARAAAAR
jgi:amidohydrolase